jgi:hypothetical protein
MAIGTSPRLGITRWSADTDVVSRAQFDGDHGKLDDLVAMAIQGLAADRPAAAIQRRLHYATDTGVLSLDTGTAWVEVLTEPRANAAYVAKADQTLQRIAETRLGAAGSVTISSIPANFRHLLLVVHGRSTNASADDGLRVRCNGDTGAVYDFQTLVATGTTVAAGENIGASFVLVGRIPAANATAGLVGSAVVDIPDYAQTTLDKTLLSRNTNKRAAAAGGLDTRVHTGTYRSTAAIHTLNVAADLGLLAAGSVVTLYGMKGA